MNRLATAAPVAAGLPVPAYPQPAVDFLVRKREAALVSRTVRAGFRCVAVYLEGCRQSAPPDQLAAAATAAAELAGTALALAARQPWHDAAGPIDAGRCLADLDRWVRALSQGADFPASERAHALDALIAMFVRIDGANRDHAAAPAAGAGNTAAGRRSAAPHRRDDLRLRGAAVVKAVAP